MTVAVLCARNKRNGGMYSVDLAAQQFFETIGVPFTLCRSQGETSWGQLRYRRFREWDGLANFDAIVCWGDWQTHPKYGEEDYSFAEAKYEGNRSKEEAIRRWRSIYQLAASRPDDRRPMLTVGCSFIGAEAMLGDPATLEAFSTYISRSNLIIPRDAASYNTLAKLFPDKGNIIPGGLDPALLAEPLSERTPPSGTFAYCFDRELRPLGREITAMVQKLSGSRPLYVDWNKRRFPKHLKQKDFTANIKAISGSDFCITDLYHFAANAINLNVPVICCGRSQASTSVTTNSDKKRELMAQFGLADLYVEPVSARSQTLEAALAAVAHERIADRLNRIQIELESARRQIRKLVWEHLRATDKNI
jgi:hypothetical protein